MHLLAFDTSTDRLSIAVERAGRQWLHEGPGGAQASTDLIPAILGLLAQAGLSLAALDALVFGRGPGAFTGLRSACAVAQGLAFGARAGAGIPVLPVDTLLALAEEARHAHGSTRVLATLDARMDQVYAAAYRWDAGRWQALDQVALCAPEAVHVPDGFTLAGNARAVYGERLARAAPSLHALPTATALLRLAPALLAAGAAVAADAALPLYVRDKVAQTSVERAAARQEAAPGAPRP